MLTRLLNFVKMFLGKGDFLLINFLRAIGDVFISILRLITLLLIALLTGIQHIIFNSTEVANITLSLIPQKRHRDRLAFIDDLCMYNLDLVTKANMPPGNYIPFKEDSDEDLPEDFPDSAQFPEDLDDDEDFPDDPDSNNN